jgi:hypothetical protein
MGKFFACTANAVDGRPVRVGASLDDAAAQGAKCIAVGFLCCVRASGERLLSSLTWHLIVIAPAFSMSGLFFFFLNAPAQNAIVKQLLKA